MNNVEQILKAEFPFFNVSGTTANLNSRKNPFNNKMIHSQPGVKARRKKRKLQKQARRNNR